MPHPTIILPFSLAPAEHAKDLLAALQAPSLAQLLAHASPGERHASDKFAPLLPHEQWLADGASDNSPAIATGLMQELGLAPEPGYWFVLEPVHFHVARDHLVLTDRRQLDLEETVSRTLFNAAHPLFAELGYTLCFGNARHWFLRADSWAGLRTSTPDAACGHNIDVWLPKGQGERDWRRLHNEVQMLWHTHPANQVREQRGEPRINALWLWGGADACASPCTDSVGLQTLVRNRLSTPALSDLQQHSPLLLEALCSAALANDWSAWLTVMADLDSQWMTPLLARLKQGHDERLTLVLTDSTRAIEWQLRRASMRKFWVRASLARLFS